MTATSKHEAPTRNAPPASESQQAVRLGQSLVRAATSLAMVPVNMLPEEPRGHLKVAGREFTRAVASLTRRLADSLDRLAAEPKNRSE